jgi:hypothetical protein
MTDLPHLAAKRSHSKPLLYEVESSRDSFTSFHPLFLFFERSLFKMATQQQERPSKKRPVHELRLGRIRAAVWENSTQNGTRHNVTVSRLYKDGDDWKDSTSFGRDDLPLLAKVADLAHSWIFEQSGATSGHVNGNGNSPEHDEF